MKVFLAALVFIGIGVLGMCFNIIFRKDGEFPETEVSKNKNMKKLGIKCMHELEEEDRRRDAASKNGGICKEPAGADCASCSFFKNE